MSVSIRLARRGRKKQPFYHMVVTDSRNARDGRFIEKIGHFNPLTKGEDRVVLKAERAEHWLSVGAKPSATVAKIFLAQKLGTEKQRADMQNGLDLRQQGVESRLKKEADAKAAEAAAAKAAEDAAAAEAAAAEAAAAAPAEAPAEEQPAS